MPRGITLLEVMVVVAIVGILAALSVVTLQGMKQRASFGATVQDVEAAVRETRVQALARGTDTAFVVDTVNNRYWGVERNAAFDMSAFDLSTATILLTGTLPEGTVFGPTAGYGAALPAPFNGVPTPTAAGCTFCTGTGTTGLGIMLFESGGPVRFSGSPTDPGQQFTITATRDNVTHTAAVAVIARSGVIQLFEK